MVLKHSVGVHVKAFSALLVFPPYEVRSYLDIRHLQLWHLVLNPRDGRGLLSMCPGLGPTTDLCLLGSKDELPLLLSTS